MIKTVLVLIVIVYMVRMTNQVRKPSGRMGRAVVTRMNFSHAALTDWGLEHVRIEPSFTILDVGCGGGRTIREMAARATAGRVLGVDYSEASVEASREANRDAVADGRVEVQQGSVSRLPFADAMFDLVTAVETHYYWPDLANDAREILRVLKPGGTLLVIAEAYKGRYGWLFQLAMLPMRAKLMSADEHRAWLETAGFTGVEVSEKRGHGWICVTGRKA
ncbi:MAG TPA: class I SAM-dependent methyltransferase [Verrucomicrobiae bacterium]|nr:class I SAM-dependent methyltransferase [Verrucomicrobiae bacterium]